MLVTSVGRLTGPRRATPTKPAVLVLTPSMGRGPSSISSTYTPGARYSGIVPSSLSLPPEPRSGGLVLRRAQPDPVLVPALGSHPPPLCQLLVAGGRHPQRQRRLAGAEVREREPALGVGGCRQMQVHQLHP